jgi:hypothetical protein
MILKIIFALFIFQSFASARTMILHKQQRYIVAADGKLYISERENRVSNTLNDEDWSEWMLFPKQLPVGFHEIEFQPSNSYEDNSLLAVGIDGNIYRLDLGSESGGWTQIKRQVPNLVKVRKK